MPRLVGSDAVGHYVCVYDPWNRLIKLQSDDTTPIVYATMAYDGRGRRISKGITNSGELEGVPVLSGRRLRCPVNLILDIVSEGIKSRPGRTA